MQSSNLLEENSCGWQIPPINIYTPYTESFFDQCNTFLEDLCDIHLYPWQKNVLRHWLAIDDNREWIHQTNGLVVSRQNGKSELIVARMLIGVFLMGEDFVVYSAHLFKSAKLVFKRLAKMCNVKDSFLNKHLAKNGVRTTTGQESINFVVGGHERTIDIVTRSTGGGRGYTCNLLVLDEAMIMSHELAEDIIPIVSAVHNHQIIACGSAGNKQSQHFGSLRKGALGKDSEGISWCEWSPDICNDFCEPDCTEHDDFTNVEVWRKTNPSLGHSALSVKTIRNELRDMSRDGFLRERLSVGKWPVEGETFSVIDKTSWDNAEDGTLQSTGRVVFAVTTTLDRTKSVIVAAGFTNDVQNVVVVEIIGSEQGPDSKPGTKWVVPRIKELCERYDPYAIIIDSKSQAASFIEELEEAFIEVLMPSGHEYARASAEFAAGVVGTEREPSWIRHIGQPELTTAVASSNKRKLSGLWAFGRLTDSSDITSLEAGVLAVWGLKQLANSDPMDNVWFVR